MVLQAVHKLILKQIHAKQRANNNLLKVIRDIMQEVVRLSIVYSNLNLERT